MGLGYVGAGGAAGAYSAMEKLKALVYEREQQALEQKQRDQQLAFQNQRQIAGDERANQSLALQGRTLNENIKYRQEQEAARLAEQTRAAGRAEVDDTQKAVAMTPRGTILAPPMKVRLQQAGLSGRMEDQPANLASRVIGAGASGPETTSGALQQPNDVQERTGEPYAQSSPARQERTSLLPSPQELQLDQTNRRADAAAERQVTEDAKRLAHETEMERLAQTREGRLQSWGPPMVVIADPNVPGGTRVVARPDVPPGGAAGPQPGSARAQEISNAVGLDQLTNLEQQFRNGADKLVGPASGRAYAVGQKIPGVPVNTTFAKFQADTASFRNAVIKAITGAQMSEPEARRIREQIPEVTDKPEVWQQKAQATRENLSLLSSKQAATRGAAPAPTGGNVPMVAPDGGSLMVPAEKVAEMEALGAKRR